MVMETFRDEPDKAPDRAREALLADAFEAAKTDYLRRVTAVAERERCALAARRSADAMAELRAAEAAADACALAEVEAIRAYATLAPHRVRTSGISPPSVNDRLLTFNRIGEAYAAAAEAIAAAAESDARIQATNKTLAAINRELMRASELHDESARKRLATPEGLAEACASDLALFAAKSKMQAASAERTAYEERVRRGEISAEGARDHDMAQNGFTFVSAPMSGVVIERIVRYGALPYYVLRDLQNRRALLSGDGALEPLRDLVFDIGFTMGVVTATVHRGAKPGTMRVLDQIKTCVPAVGVDAAYERHREQLRQDRIEGAFRPRDAAERDVVNALARLARQLAGSKPPIVRAMR